jgi:metal-responsive CopG/Arc/MetJ family transcriptional regulator
MKSNGKSRYVTAVELGKALDKKVNRFARREEMTRSQVVRKAVRRFLSEAQNATPSAERT